MYRTDKNMQIFDKNKSLVHKGFLVAQYFACIYRADNLFRAL